MALFVETLAVSHFRSHKRCRLSLDGRPVALFGANGAGKTNILEAVSLLSPGRGLRRAKSADIAMRPADIGWTLHAQVERLRDRHEIDMRAEGQAARVLTIDGKSAPQLRLGAITPVLWLVPAMDRLWIEGAEGRRRFLDRMTLSFLPEHAALTIEYERAMRQRNRLLKDQVSDPHWYRALESQMARAAVPIDWHRRRTLILLAEAQAQAQTAFPAADLTLAHPDEDLPEDADDLVQVLAAGRSRDIAAGRSLIGPHRADLLATYASKGQPASECSTGEQKALLVSLILANARALQEQIGAPPVLLLDEVAAHLDPGRRAALYDEICALGAQAWMTGTEPGLFDTLGPRAQRFEVTETSGQSDVHPRG